MRIATHRRSYRTRLPLPMANPVHNHYSLTRLGDKRYYEVISPESMPEDFLQIPVQKKKVSDEIS
jgi:hypothetical protein